MQLYKSRGFGDFFQDTFAFLKLNGKHFFKHYLTINGIFLIFLMVMMYFFTKFYTDVIFGGLMQDNPTVIDDYMNDNAGLFIILFIVFFIIALIAGVISYSYVPIYLKLYAKEQNSAFGTSELVSEYKSNIGKIFIFLLCALLLAIPLVIALGIGVFILVITIVGMLLVPVLIGAFSLFYNMSLMEYLEKKRGIWDSFGYAWTLLTSKFWPAVGSVGLFIYMGYIIQGIFSIIPYIFGVASLFTTIESGNPDPEQIGYTMMIVMLAIFFLSFLAGAILGVIVQLNQGIIFYSLKEENENINTKSVIDQIGSGE